MSKQDFFSLRYSLSPLTYELEGVLTDSSDDFFKKNLPLPCVWTEYIKADFLPAYKEHVEQLLETGSSKVISYELIIAGREFVVSDDSACIHRSDSWPLFIGRVRIKELAKGNNTDLSLDLFEDLQYQALMGNLSAAVVHDFKNLLGGIQNIIEWCSMETALQKPVSKALGRTLGYIDQSNALVSSILHFASPSSRGESCMQLGMAVKELETLIRHCVPSNIAVEYELNDTHKFCGDIITVQEMVLNLCMNARNAMGEKGSKLFIKTADFTKDEQAWVSVSVIDEGCGIAKADLETIFDAFYTRSKGGTGLGLWMVSKKLEEMKGYVSVDSELGKGSQFTLNFPCVEANEVLSLDDNTDRDEQYMLDSQELQIFQFPERKTVLFVEDEVLIRSSIETMLESFGLDVISAEDGLEAFNLFKEHKEKIDFVVTDFVLPGMKGNELLRRIRLESAMPVFVMSAYSGNKGSAELKDLGATGFISKPFKTKDLLNLILEKVYES